MEETFYEARRRHRRASWRLTALSFVAVVVTSIPVAAVITPPVLALALIAGDLASLVLPVPDVLADVIDTAARRVGEGAAEGVPTASPVTRGEVAALVGPAVPLGLAVVMLAWLTVRRLFLRAGPEAVVLASGGRPPRGDDLAERQLVNLVEEIALAAGVPPPQVRILEGDVANAGIVGRSIDDAIVVVSRGLLDQLGRRATGAVVADLVASAVNGDLRVALSLAANAQSIDLLSGLLAAPTSPRARRTLRHLVRLSRPGRRRRWGRQRTERREEERYREARFIVEELVALGQLEDLDEEEDTGGFRALLSLPPLAARVALAVLSMVVVGLFAQPVLAMLWRRRRLLADATAVELTRDPDALIAALEHLQERGASVPAGPWSHLFFVGPELERDRLMRRFEENYDAVSHDGRRPGESQAAAFGRRHRARRAAQSDYMRASGAVPSGSSGSGDMDLVAFLPPIEKRIERLAALGGTRSTVPYRRRMSRGLLPLEIVGYGALCVVLVPILVVLIGLLVAIVLGLASLAVMMEVAVLAPFVLVSHALLR